MTERIGQTLLTYKGHLRDESATCHCMEHSIRALAWSPKGTYIASAGWDGTIQVWNALTGICHITYRQKGGSIESIAWSPKGKFIASGGRSEIIHIWEVLTGECKTMYSGHVSGVYTEGINSLSWSPDGKHIASCGHDRIINIWNVSTSECHIIYKGHLIGVNSVSWSPNGKYIASCGDNNTVHIWDTMTGNNIYTDKITYSPYMYCQSVAWSPDSKYIASAPISNTVKVWEALSGKNRNSYSEHTGGEWFYDEISMEYVCEEDDGIHSVSWSPDGKYIASSGADQTVQVWDAYTSKQHLIYRNHIASGIEIDWSPNGKYIASGGSDSMVQVWRAR